jgi:hypothetical protein
MPIVSELREVIGALQSEAEFEAAVRELGAAGIDRARISFLAQEEIAASCAGAVGCDIKHLPRVEIGLSDDRQQVRTLATSLAATVASFAGAGAVLAATSGAAAPACWRGWAYKHFTQQASGVVQTCLYPLRCECRQLGKLPRRHAVDYAGHQHDAQIIGQLIYRPFEDVSDRTVGHLAFLEQLLASTLAGRTI